MFRDLYVTTKSFITRITDYLKYRNATRDMNTRYPDATAEQLERDGTCIICREEMRPWQDQNPHAGAGAAPARSSPDERRRPKKLPCGHILHVGCLRSWLERQQVCPTCRRSVLAPPGPTHHSGTRPARPGAHPRPDDNQPPQENRAPGDGDGNVPQPRPDQNRPGNGPAGIRARTFNFGGFRLTFATGNALQVRNALENIRNHNPNRGNQTEHAGDANINHSEAPRAGIAAAGSDLSVQEQLGSLERQIVAEIGRLSASREQLAVVRALEGELSRLRALQSGSGSTQGLAAHAGLPPPPVTMPTVAPRLPFLPAPLFPQPAGSAPHVQQQVFGAQSQQAALGPGNTELPEGLTLPEGWSVLPLQRITPDATPPSLGQDNNFVVPQAAFPAGARSGSMPPSLHGHVPGLAPSSRGSRSATPQPSSSGLATGAVYSQLGPQVGPTAPLAGPATIAAHTSSNTSGIMQSPPAVVHDQPAEEDSDDNPQLVTGLPDWSNAGASQTQLPSASSSLDSANGAPTEEQGQTETKDGFSSDAGKGKGRAATVEETSDHEA